MTVPARIKLCSERPLCLGECLTVIRKLQDGYYFFLSSPSCYWCAFLSPKDVCDALQSSEMESLFHGV